MHPQDTTVSICALCQCAFYVKPSRRARAVYCSKACYDVIRAAQRAEPNCICETCGTPFYASPSRLATGGKLCSMACRTRDTLTKRLWARVHKTDGCWLWTGATTKFGYGKIAAGCKSSWIAAHRRAWEEASGASIPQDQRVLHTCDVPACVRNDDAGTYIVRGVAYPRYGHLFLAPDRVNHIDCWDKRRAALDPSWWDGKKRDGRNGKYVSS